MREANLSAFSESITTIPAVHRRVSDPRLPRGNTAHAVWLLPPDEDPADTCLGPSRPAVWLERKCPSQAAVLLGHHSREQSHGAYGTPKFR